eukprot:m51a1_g3765 putative protein serine threonine kinase (447) ;mRNA; r:124318-126303
MAQPCAPARQPLFTEGTIVRGKWRIGDQIGVGAFGEIYVARNIVTNEQVAIKAELNDEKKQALRAEVAILRRLQGCPYVCQFISCGRQEDVNFLVMELLGENLSELRKRMGTFTPATCARLVVEMIRALQAIHELGIIHRDVKPSNFVMGRKASAARRLFIIDFGLSRKYTGPAGEIKPPRPSAGFRGTARYASVYSHACKELSARDDLWSVLYLAIEFATGTLPWKQQRDRDKIAEMKNHYLSRRLVENLSSEYEDFMNHLQTLDYYSRPNYAYLIGLFDSLARRLGATPDTPYDWEVPGDNSASSASVRQQQPKAEPKPYKEPHDRAVGPPSSMMTPSKPNIGDTAAVEFPTLPGIEDDPVGAQGIAVSAQSGDLRKSGNLQPASATNGTPGLSKSPVGSTDPQPAGAAATSARGNGGSTAAATTPAKTGHQEKHHQGCRCTIL